MVSFPTQIPNCDSCSFSFGFLSFDASICSAMTFALLGNSYLVVSVSIDFLLNSKRDALFDHKVFVIMREIFYGRKTLNWVLLLLLVFFVSGLRLELIYISLIKYQVRPHSSPWFSAAFAAAMIHRNKFFRLHQENQSKPRDRLVTVAKGFLKLPNLHMLIKQKNSSLPRNLALGTFCKLTRVVSAEVNPLYLLHSVAWRCCLVHLIKRN